MGRPSNGIATLLRIIAILTFIGGALIGFEEGQGYYEFYFEEAMPYWAGTFVAGSVFLGFAEIITLLQGINDKLNKAPQGDNDNHDQIPGDATQESQTVYRFVCRSCGKKNTGWYQKCPNCGAVGKMEKLPKVETIIEANDIPITGKNIATSNMHSGGWVCPNCGRNHYDYETSCSCGKSRLDT